MSSRAICHLSCEEAWRARRSHRSSDLYQGQRVMTNSPLIPPGDYLPFLSLLAHISTLKRKGGHALSIVCFAEPNRATAITCFCFSVSHCLYLAVFLSPPHSHGLKQDLIIVQWLCHTDPYLTLKEILLTPSPGAPLVPLSLTREGSYACY